MPKSKRAKVVHTSSTKKKGKELTLRLYANIQECIPKYPYIYVFRVDNMRNTYLKDVRTRLSDSRLFFGKTKVMAVALGLSAESEPYENTSKLTAHLHGAVGLLFSPRPPPELLAFFASFTPADFARAGTIAPRSFTIPAGIVYSRGGEIPEVDDVPLSHSIEPGLRKLGVPTRLVKGKVVLGEEGADGFVVCREGQVLGSGQTTLLKMFGIAVAEFRVDVVCWWEREGGKVQLVDDTGVSDLVESRHELSDTMEVEEDHGENV